MFEICQKNLTYILSKMFYIKNIVVDIVGLILCLNVFTATVL